MVYRNDSKIVNLDFCLTDLQNSKKRRKIKIENTDLVYDKVFTLTEILGYMLIIC